MTDYYQILGLDRKYLVQHLKPLELKDAYRRTLLRNHPDKVEGTRSAQAGETGTRGTAITVDEITQAYKTLLDPVKRAEYDRSLAQRDFEDSGEGRKRGRQTGLEVVDLDALAYDERIQTWSRTCRCGDNRGFLVSEAELEKHVEDGELTVGCRGCSLWLKVLFGMDDGD
jgi:diphthamide biosynthesis protein 4